MERLSLTTLPERSERISVPGVDPRTLSIGLVHLGIGAFHRAHQAVYTEGAYAATGDDRWGTFAVTGRSAAVVEQLAPQDCLYGVLTKSAERSSLQVVGAVRGIVSGGAAPRTALDAIASSGAQVVTLTVTEKGYPRTPSGGLALGTDAVTADLALVESALAGHDTANRAGTAVGLLAAGLATRFAGSAAPISVVSCDNLPGNGAQLGRLVHELADATGAGEFVAWLQDRVAFPSTMVDRIVPATTDADRAEAADLLQLYDAGLVVAEPFGQWVIEDRFTADRPAWERAGVVFTADVAPYEKAKLRLLNGTHSLLAYLGALDGYATIAEALADDRLLDAARGLQREDAIPTLEAPPALDLEEYGEQILRRFANPHLRHTTIQVAADGSQKLPIRILETARGRLRAGAMPQYCALAVAAWMVYVRRGQDGGGRDLPLNDPLAGLLRERAAGSDVGLVDRMLAIREVFDEEIAGHDAFRSAVRSAVKSLMSFG